MTVVELSQFAVGIKNKCDWLSPGCLGHMNKIEPFSAFPGQDMGQLKLLKNVLFGISSRNTEKKFGGERERGMKRNKDPLAGRQTMDIAVMWYAPNPLGY